MADKFGGQKDGRQTTGATFYDVPAETVNANALYFPNFPASPFFGVAEYPVAAGDLGAFTTSGVFVFDKPTGWIDNPGRKVFYRPKTAATGEIVAQEVKGDVFVGYQVIDNINPQKLGVLLASPEFCMNVLMVTSTADSGAGSLRQAIADANDGDVILFDADIFPADETPTTIYLSSNITINKSVTINCDGRVTLDGQSAVRIISAISGDITINNVIFAHGSASYGGGIGVSSTTNLTLNGCTFDSCSATNSGGAFYASESSQNTFNNCVFDACTSASYGGVLRANNASKNVLNNCIIADCTASSGGAFYAGDTSQNTLYGCTISGCSATSGGGVCSTSSSQNTLNDCVISGCSATNGGAIYNSSTSQNTLTNCTISGCSATNGGGVCSSSTSHNTLNDCTISGCSATNYGGGVYSNNTSQSTLNDCIFNSCDAKNGGGAYCTNTSVNALTNSAFKDCTATTNGSGFYSGGSSQNTLSNCVFDNCELYVNSAALTIDDGITTIAAATLNAAIITIADGAALTITTSATIGAATFTSAGRGYLATAAGIDISSATLTNVVACAYGAGLESFTIDEDGANWTAQDLTTPILIETRDAGGDWQTLTDNATGGEYATTFALESTARAFDGVAFFVATLPGYWQADAGAVDTNDWSVKGFAAANSNGGGDAQGDAAQGWTVTPSTVTPNADGV